MQKYFRRFSLNRGRKINGEKDFTREEKGELLVLLTEVLLRLSPNSFPLPPWSLKLLLLQSVNVLRRAGAMLTGE